MNKAIKISNPNPYTSKETGTEMTSFSVTGSAEQLAFYNQWCIDNKEISKKTGLPSVDDNGKPLKHFTREAGAKYGISAELILAENQDGTTYWFMNNDKDKQLSKLIAGLSPAAQAIYATRELEKAEALAQVYADNRSANIKALQAKSKDTFNVIPVDGKRKGG